MTSKDREAFEKWVNSQSFYEFSLQKGNGSENGYWESETEMAFTVWQAARAHYAPKLTEIDTLKNVAAISAAIGYISSIKPGTVITEDFVERWNSYYLPGLEKSLKAAGLRFKEEA